MSEDFAPHPEPPPLSIAVDAHGHAWQAFVTTDGSGVNLWHPASPRWGGFAAPAKTWRELLALGRVRVVTYGRTDVDESTAEDEGHYPPYDDPAHTDSLRHSYTG